MPENTQEVMVTPENPNTPRVLYRRIRERMQVVLDEKLSKIDRVAVEVVVIPDGLETTYPQIRKAMSVSMQDMMDDGMPTVLTDPVRIKGGFSNRQELVIGVNGYSGTATFGETEKVPCHFIYLDKHKKASDKAYEVCRTELLKRTNSVLELFDKKPLPDYKLSG